MSGNLPSESQTDEESKVQEEVGLVAEAKSHPEEDFKHEDAATPLVKDTLETII